MYTYPPNIACILHSVWPSLSLHDKPELPTAPSLIQLLEHAYAASLTTEEGRSVIFRVVYVHELSLLDDQGFVFFKFERPRQYTEQELRRLAPATDSSITMITVAQSDDQKLEIIGLFSISSSWQKLANAQIDSGTYPPSALTISVNGPGSMRVESSGQGIIGIEKGVLLNSPLNALKEGPIFDFLLPALGVFAGDPNGGHIERAIFFAKSEVYLRFLVRVLQKCRALHHGGTFLLLRNLGECRSGLSIKYPCNSDQAWRLMLQLRDLRNHLSQLTGDARRDVERRLVERRLDEANQRAEDLTGVFAKLSSVDGCVVLSDRLDLIGFGAVIDPADRSPSEIRLCKDTLCQRSEPLSTNKYGTRHQSAFRFCSRTETAVAFVLSQDGGVKAVTRVGSDVILFDDLNLGLDAWKLSHNDIVGDLLRNQQQTGPAAPEG